MERHRRRLVEHVYFDAHGNALTYDRYINSSTWERRRRAYFRGHKRICRVCRTNQKIHLHHLTYERVGAEHDEDLMPLCEQCHDIVHGFAKKRPDLALRDATFFAVAQMLSARAHQAETKSDAENFVPLNKRPGYKPGYNGHLTGRAGRLSGLPITVVGRGRA